MLRLYPNQCRKELLDTVLEVPIPEEAFAHRNTTSKSPACWPWVRSHADHHRRSSNRGDEIQLLLGIIGAPLLTLPIRSTAVLCASQIGNDSLEVSSAKYIVKQYVAACGGQKALESVSSMCVVGKVRMTVSDFHPGNTKASEIGGFVLWQKNPGLWSLELVLSGCKLNAGSDGRGAWRQTLWQQPHRGPPKPLRRTLQGLDPRTTADLFSNAVCTGEEAVHGEDCFKLKLNADAFTLREWSSDAVEIIRHSMFGYFSTRTGLLVQLEDTHVLRFKPVASGEGSVYWKTTMESTIGDYRTVDGINIAHSGRTTASVQRVEAAHGFTTMRMEEAWSVEEVDLNIQGLSMDCFLAPADLKEERECCYGLVNNDRRPSMRAHQAAANKFGPLRVAAIDIEDSNSTAEF